MKKEAYEILRENADAHWWNVAKDEVLIEQIRSLKIPSEANICELGSGTGDFLAKLNFKRKIGLDCHIYEPIDNGNFFVVGDISYLPLKDNSIDFLLLVDVLEHIKDDKALISNCLRLLKPNAKMLIFVPALNILWSDLDIMGMHYRRYNKEMIKGLFSGCGARYKVIKASYVNFLLFPYILLVRVIQKGIKMAWSGYNSANIKKPATLINAAFRFIFGMERYILKHVDFPIGASYLYIIERGISIIDGQKSRKRI